jgi:hypothetical protein
MGAIRLATHPHVDIETAGNLRVGNPVDLKCLNKLKKNMANE